MEENRHLLGELERCLGERRRLEMLEECALLERCRALQAEHAASEADAAALATYRDSLQPVISYLPEQARIRVDAALEVAYQAHNGQTRRSGEPYVEHPISVATVLAHSENSLHAKPPSAGATVPGQPTVVAPE